MSYLHTQFDSMPSLGSMTSIPGDDKGWDGTIDVTIAAPFEKVWEIGSDWLKFPLNFVVECTEGQSGVPGCVRKLRLKESENWVAERLTHIDHNDHVFSYDVVGGDVGIEPGYQATFQAIKEGERTTRVLWAFRFSAKQPSVEVMTPLIMAKVTGYIKDLQALARN